MGKQTAHTIDWSIARESSSAIFAMKLMLPALTMKQQRNITASSQF